MLSVPQLNRAITHFHALVHFGIVTWLCCYSCMFATELMVSFVCFDWFSFLLLFFLFLFVHYQSNMHSYMHVFFFFKRKISHPSIQPSIHSLFHLSTFPYFLPQDIRKMRLLLWYGKIDSLAVMDIFSSKITFLYDPCVFIFRIFNKLDNITWKSVLSPTSSPFSC